MNKISLPLVVSCILCVTQAGYSQEDNKTPPAPSTENITAGEASSIDNSGATQAPAITETNKIVAVEARDDLSETKSSNTDGPGLLKWIFAIIGSLVGALLAMTVGFQVLKSKVARLTSEQKEKIGDLKADYEQRLTAAEVTIDKVKDGAEGVILLDSEALQLLRRFETDNRNIYTVIEQTANATKETTDQFKESLRQSLGGLVENINSVMEQSAADAKRTRDYLDIIVPRMEKNEVENEALKKGMNMQLVGPLLESFFRIRNELIKHINRSQKREVTKEDLKFLIDLEAEIARSIHGVGLDEIRFDPHDDMRVVATHHWKDFGVAKKTDQRELHGMCAYTKYIGYIQRDNTSESPHVVRKATVQLYSFDSGLDQTSEPATSHIPANKTISNNPQANSE